MVAITGPSSRLRDNHVNKRPIDMWVQEAIFGHRFIEEQKPFMLVLEMLNVCSALQVDKKGEVYGQMYIFDHAPASERDHEFIQGSY